MPSAGEVRRRRYSGVFNRNLVTFDPGFETGLLSPNGGVAGAGGTWSINTTNQRNGGFCAAYDPLGQTGAALLVANGAQGNATVQPAATEGESFYFEFWTRAETAAATNNVEAQILFFNAAGGLITSTGGGVVNPGVSYEKVSHTATAPALTAHVAFRIVVGNNGNDNDLFFDDRLAKRVVA